MNTLHLPTDRLSYRFGKRLFDILLCIALSPFVLLAMVFVAVAVKLSSPGPILYRHTRVGFRNRAFSLWKFRSMFHESDQIFWSHLAQSADARREWMCYRKLRRDPRVTKVGGLLRRLNLDELPQMINVFLGDMSLVGPRPVVKEELERYGSGGELYTAARPGITGLWQVSGRGCLPYEKRVALDVEYVSTWSLGSDFVLLAKTLNAICTCRGAF
jgi:exopolysaccharide production protein ExoY